jgi:acetoin utilization protein AcuC
VGLLPGGYRHGMPQVPLLVFGPRSLTYDFGPSHPLTPRRFGPGIDLLRAIGAEPGLAPEPATDEELLTCHTAPYLDVVKRFSEIDMEPWAEPEAGIGSGDDPAFHGMHEAAAAVAGGSLRAIEAILRGDVEHAFHPGGGLHHAMPSRASGFCIYDDPALAIARARADGLRVLYVDLDVHHGDGVQAIHAADPGVLTLSFHESGHYLFPGTGFVGELGEGSAAGSVVNVPLEPGTGEEAWLAAVRRLVPELAAAFAPDVVVSQHGCDTHASDPLAHLSVTTTAMGAAARLVDAVAHARAGGRWLSTGGGGYGVYRVVPRAWSLVWLAGAHRDVPDRLPGEWRERWAAEAERYGDRDLPSSFDDPANAGLPLDGVQDAADTRAGQVTEVVRRLAVPAIVREAVDRGWWSPLDSPALPDAGALPTLHSGATPTILAIPDRATLERLSFAPRLVAGLEPRDLATILASPGVEATAAVAGQVVVGLVASAPVDGGEPDGPHLLLTVGVAPDARNAGLATALLRRHVNAAPARDWRASVTLAERDPVEPLDRSIRASIAQRLLDGAGFEVASEAGPVGRADPPAIEAARR